MSKKYNKRVTLERINSRLYNKYAFENHTIRGKVKIEFAVYKWVLWGYVKIWSLAKCT